MKIALDLRFYRSGTGGLGRYSRNLLAELIRLDRSNQYTAIITPADIEEFKVRAPNLTQLVIDAPHFSVAEQTKLLKALNAGNFDLVHFANFNHPVLYRRPFVVTVHDLIMHLFPSGAQQKSALRRAAYRKVMSDCRRARSIIVPSQSTKNDLVRMLKLPEKNIVVTLEGSEGGFKPASNARIQEVCRRFQIPERYLLFVSRWERYKGLPVLLEAFAALKSQYPDLGLVICGKPSAQAPDIADQVRAAQAKLTGVVAPGFVTDAELTALYSGASAYVHPSWYEGFGIMILEAFAAGAPVITSNTSSLPEVVGEAGLLIDPHNQKALEKAIARVLEEPKLAAELRSKGFAQTKKFSWKKMAEQTLEVYREALK